MGLTLLIILLFLVIFVAIGVYFSYIAHYKKVATGKEGIIGEKGECTITIKKSKKGKVLVHGEVWEAVSDNPVSKGKVIIVVELMDRMTLKVKEVK